MEMNDARCFEFLLTIPLLVDRTPHFVVVAVRQLSPTEAKFRGSQQEVWAEVAEKNKAHGVKTESRPGGTSPPGFLKFPFRLR